MLGAWEGLSWAASAPEGCPKIAPVGLNGQRLPGLGPSGTWFCHQLEDEFCGNWDLDGWEERALFVS